MTDRADVPVDWRSFAEAAPALADAGRSLIYQYGVGLGYLATVDDACRPRIHPVCPFILGDHLHVFVIRSAKLQDLLARGHYALHAYASEDVDDEFAIRGVALPVDDPARRAEAVAAYHVAVADDDRLFELFVDEALVARYRHRGDRATYTRWRASG